MSEVVGWILDGRAYCGDHVEKAFATDVVLSGESRATELRCAECGRQLFEE